MEEVDGTLIVGLWWTWEELGWEKVGEGKEMIVAVSLTPGLLSRILSIQFHALARDFRYARSRHLTWAISLVSRRTSL